MSQTVITVNEPSIGVSTDVLTAVVTVDETNIDVFVTETPVVVSVTETPIVISQSITGLQGPKGDPGSAGLAGGTFTYNQLAAQQVWTVVHNLGFHPAVTTVDSSNSVIQGDVEYIDTNTVSVTFSQAVSGTIYLS